MHIIFNILTRMILQYPNNSNQVLAGFKETKNIYTIISFNESLAICDTARINVFSIVPANETGKEIFSKKNLNIILL